MTGHTTCRRMAGAMLSMLMAASAAVAADPPGLDVKVTGEASPSDAGLPAYPGAKPYKESEQSTSAGNVAISTPFFGLKVVAMNFESTDKPERVAAFYRQALSKYGKVVECSAEKRVTAKAGSDDLACDADEPGKNSIVYKVGVEDDDERIVAIKPHGGGTRFALVHIVTRD